MTRAEFVGCVGTQLGRFAEVQSSPAVAALASSRRMRPADAEAVLGRTESAQTAKPRYCTACRMLRSGPARSARPLIQLYQG